MSELNKSESPAVDCWPCGTPKQKPVVENTSVTSAPKEPAATNTTTVRSASLYPCGGTRTQEFHLSQSPVQTIDRRTLLIGTGTTLAAVAGFKTWQHLTEPKAEVFVARHQRYDGPLQTTIRDGLLASGFQPEQIRGKRVLLKPNLVEPVKSSPQMTTNPAVVVAAAEVFLGWGAEVTIGEGPGHVRDTEHALYESGMADAIDDLRVPFADINYEETIWVENRGRVSDLPGFHFPKTVVEADLIVSMPKLKTHHWMGFTAAMKNLYGVIPGIRYGWPKNVLHFNGIPETIFDINASVPRTIGIIDGIECMEGDGPILGTSKQMGLILIGTNPAALDATAARIMGLVPEKVPYLILANNRLGPVADRQITQRGERWEPLVNPFQVLDEPHLRMLVSKGTPLIT
jgi:uncharacterized protein (DUF362 family)